MARAISGKPKLTTKEVATIAKTAASAVKKPEGKPEAPKPPTAKERTMVLKLQQSISSCLGSLEWLEAILVSSAQRARLAELVVQSNGKTAERVKRLHALLTRVNESVQGALRTRTVTAATR